MSISILNQWLLRTHAIYLSDTLIWTWALECFICSFPTLVFIPRFLINPKVNSNKKYYNQISNSHYVFWESQTFQASVMSLYLLIYISLLLFFSLKIPFPLSSPLVPFFYLVYMDINISKCLSYSHIERLIWRDRICKGSMFIYIMGLTF